MFSFLIATLSFVMAFYAMLFLRDMWVVITTMYGFHLVAFLLWTVQYSTPFPHMATFFYSYGIGLPAAILAGSTDLTSNGSPLIKLGFFYSFVCILVFNGGGNEVIPFGALLAIQLCFCLCLKLYRALCVTAVYTICMFIFSVLDMSVKEFVFIHGAIALCILGIAIVNELQAEQVFLEKKHPHINVPV